jgi:hypothetical protein
MYEIKDLLKFSGNEKFESVIVLDGKAFVVTSQRIIEISKKEIV